MIIKKFCYFNVKEEEESIEKYAPKLEKKIKVENLKRKVPLVALESLSETRTVSLVHNKNVVNRGDLVEPETLKGNFVSEDAALSEENKKIRLVSN